MGGGGGGGGKCRAGGSKGIAPASFDEGLIFFWGLTLNSPDAMLSQVPFATVVNRNPPE